MHDPLNVRPAQPRIKSIAFQASYTERGSQVQTFDYALYAKQILGLRVLILMASEDALVRSNGVSNAVRSRWLQHFDVHHTFGEEMDEWLKAHDCYDIYMATHGKRNGPGTPVSQIDRLMKAGVRVHIHAIFYAAVPWGSTFARVGAAVRGNGVPVVPLIVRPGELSGGDLRQQLGLSEDATVFCRHGGMSTFDLDMARQAVNRVSARRKDIVFLFLNTAPFCSERTNIIHLPAAVHTDAKSRFFRTCDAMIHARSDGETFGLSVAEFSAHNRPVMTFCPRDICDDNRTKTQKWMHAVGRRRRQVWYEHARILGSKGLYYSSQNELEAMIMTFNRTAASLRRDWNAYQRFVPEVVIWQFSAVFLQGNASG